jgi:hypothetical protein
MPKPIPKVMMNELSKTEIVITSNLLKEKKKNFILMLTNIYLKIFFLIKSKKID